MVSTNFLFVLLPGPYSTTLLHILYRFRWWTPYIFSNLHTSHYTLYLKYRFLYCSPFRIIALRTSLIVTRIRLLANPRSEALGSGSTYSISRRWLGTHWNLWKSPFRRSCRSGSGGAGSTPMVKRVHLPTSSATEKKKKRRKLVTSLKAGCDRLFQKCDFCIVLCFYSSYTGLSKLMSFYFKMKHHAVNRNSKLQLIIVLQQFCKKWES